MKWPWQRREVRSTGGDSYSDLRVRILQESASGAVTGDWTGLGALETAAGAYGRAFASATVEGAPERVRAALRPALLATAAREMVRTGEWLAVIDVRMDGSLRLLEAGTFDVWGRDPDETSWTYRCDLYGPSQTDVRWIPSAGVVHPRWSTRPNRPWRGLGPLDHARHGGKLAANAEIRLGQEMGGPVGSFLPISEQDESDELPAMIAKARGSTLVVETETDTRGGGPAGAPRREWEIKRFGAAPPVQLVTLHDNASEAVLAACGVPAAMYAAGTDASGRREAWRQFLHGSVLGLAEIMAEELRRKLDAPELRFEFQALAASDVQGRARAFKSLTDGGIDPALAARIVGVQR